MVNSQSPLLVLTGPTGPDWADLFTGSPKLLRSDAGCAMMIMMTRQQIESAVASGQPFELRMADGKEYLVPHRDYISLPPKASYVIVYDDQGHFTVLPLLTMTGLQSKVR